VNGASDAMTKSRALLLAALTLAVHCTPADAAGMRRFWRGHTPIGAISRDVITPWYVGYYGSHYSYYRPDPMYLAPRVYLPSYVESDRCWRWMAGESVYIC
jgi:hypothetical protein